MFSATTEPTLKTMKPEYVKCYYGNLNGKEAGLVVARNQKEAASIAGCSVYSFRQFWGDGGWPSSFTPKRGVLYSKPYNDHAAEYTERGTENSKGTNGE